MKMMIPGIVPGRGLVSAAALAALVSGAVLSFGSPARAQENNMLNSMLGVFGMQSNNDRDSIDYHARAPIVVPPRTDLPPPKEATRDPAWPNDPDIAQERRAALDSRTPARKSTASTGASQTDADQGRSSMPSDGPPDDCQGGGLGICLNAPLKAVKSIMTGFNSSDTVQPGVEPERRYLTEPPPGYRKATAVAKATADSPKKDNKPEDTDAAKYIRSPQPKLPVDN